MDVYDVEISDFEEQKVTKEKIVKQDKKIKDTKKKVKSTKSAKKTISDFEKNIEVKSNEKNIIYISISNFVELLCPG